MIQSSLRLRPFFPYFGSKWRISGLYPAPSRRQIIEPFAGSAGYSLAHHWLDVMLIDADDNITQTWDYLIHASADEVLALPDIVRGTTVDDYKLVDEQKKLIGYWLNATPTYPCRRLTVNAEKYPTHNYWGADVRWRIASQQSFIRHWKVTLGSYADAPGVDATWYVDPPYHRSGKAYRKSSRKIDYAALGEWCQSRSGQVIVCEQDGADWLPFEPLANVRCMSGRTSEVMWSKGGPA